MPPNAKAYRQYINALLNGEKIRNHYYYEAAAKSRFRSIHFRNAENLAKCIGKMLAYEQSPDIDKLLATMQANCYLELQKFECKTGTDTPSTCHGG